MSSMNPFVVELNKMIQKMVKENGKEYKIMSDVDVIKMVLSGVKNRLSMKEYNNKKNQVFKEYQEQVKKAHAISIQRDNTKNNVEE